MNTFVLILDYGEDTSQCRGWCLPLTAKILHLAKKEAHQILANFGAEVEKPHAATVLEVVWQEKLLLRN